MLLTLLRSEFSPTKGNVSFPSPLPPFFPTFWLSPYFSREQNTEYPSLSLLPDPTKTLATLARRDVATRITLAVSMGWNNGREPP